MQYFIVKRIDIVINMVYIVSERGRNVSTQSDNAQLYASRDGMIAQMLGRGYYTHERIAAFIGCEVEHVRKVEEWRDDEIANIREEYAVCEAVANKIMGEHRHDNDGVDAGCIYIAHTLFRGHRNRMDPGMWEGSTI